MQAPIQEITSLFCQQLKSIETNILAEVNITELVKSAQSSLDKFDQLFNTHVSLDTLAVSIDCLEKIQQAVGSFFITGMKKVAESREVLIKIVQTFQKAKGKCLASNTIALQSVPFAKYIMSTSSIIATYSLEMKDDETTLHYIEISKNNLNSYLSSNASQAEKEATKSNFDMNYACTLARVKANQKRLSEAKDHAAEARRLFYSITTTAGKLYGAQSLMEAYHKIGIKVCAQKKYEESLYWFDEATIMSEEFVKSNTTNHMIRVAQQRYSTNKEQEDQYLENFLKTKDAFYKKAQACLLNEICDYIKEVFSRINVECTTTSRLKDVSVVIAVAQKQFTDIILKTLQVYGLVYNFENENCICIQINVSKIKLQKIFRQITKEIASLNSLPPIKPSSDSKLVSQDQKDQDQKADKLKRHEQREKIREEDDLDKKTPEPEDNNPKIITEVEWNSKEYKPLTSDKPNRYFRIYGDPHIITYGFFNEKKLKTQTDNPKLLNKGRAVGERGLVLKGGHKGGQGITFTKEYLLRKFSDETTTYVTKIKMNGIYIDDRFLGKRAAVGLLKINGILQDSKVELIDFDLYVGKAHKTARR